jgi:acyl carrier protein
MKRAELTAERFIPDPFSILPGARLYRTGDLARRLPGGELEYLSRIDHQVKVRGFRIELGEIESVLVQHAGVREAVVTAREERGEKRLVAYVVAESEQEVKSVELRVWLKETLPEYMIPASFVLLDEMPLTPNGKVDRRALPAPELTTQELKENFVGPRTPTEEVVAGVLAQVLGKEQVSVHDDFFESGGHSLLATQVISRLRQYFRQEVPLRALFEAPTVAGLAEMIEADARAEQGFPVPVLRPVSRDRDLPLSFAQQRLWFASQLLSGHSLYSLPAALRLKGRLSSSALEQSLSEIVRRHEVLRTNFATIDGQPTQVIVSWQPWTLETTDLTSWPEAEREMKAQCLAEAEARKHFDLAHGPLMRASLLRLDEEDHVLLFTMHHIISDGWSMGVLIKEVAALYDAFSRNLPSPLAELPIQYADFAVWQREWLQGEVLEAQLSYWTERLGGHLPVLELPTDRPRPSAQSFRAARQSLKIEKGVAESLKALSRREGVTLFMTLLAAFQVLLYRYTGQEDIVIGTDIANRNRHEVEGLIGFFVNQLVLRTDLSGDPGFRELLTRVREVALGAYVNQDLPFEKLVQVLQPERELNRSPLFQTKFILQNAPEKALELPGLTLDSLELDFGTTPFDLVFAMRDEGEDLSGIMTYSADLFDSETIAQMIQHFQKLLESIALQPDMRLSSLRLLSDEDTHGYSSVDFPEAEMSEKDFESLFLQLNRMDLVETEYEGR